jgi:hypothetical protein
MRLIIFWEYFEGIGFTELYSYSHSFEVEVVVVVVVEFESESFVG